MARAPSPGQLDQRVWIDARVETRAADTGEVSVSWSPVVEVWARVEPLTVREFLGAQAAQSVATHRVTIRNRTGITGQHRFRWRGEPMNIVGPLDAGARWPYLSVLCSKGATTDGR